MLGMKSQLSPLRLATNQSLDAGTYQSEGQALDRQDNKLRPRTMERTDMRQREMCKRVVVRVCTDLRGG